MGGWDACVALGWGGSRDQDEGDASVPSPHRPTPAPTGKRHPSLCHHPQGGDTLLTDVNAGGSDASIAVVRSHDVLPGANFDSARGDSLASLSVLGTRCRVDRDRAATRRFGHDRIAIHARHSQRVTLTTCPLCSLRDNQRLSAAGVSLRVSQRQGAAGASGRKGRGLGAAGQRTHEHTYAQGEHKCKSQTTNQEPPAPAPTRSRWLIQPGRSHLFIVFHWYTSFP